MAKRKVNRSAIDGKFVTAKQVVESPCDTVTEAVEISTPLVKQLGCLIDGVNFVSETDSPLTLVDHKDVRLPTCEALQALTGLSECEELALTNWFDHTIASQGVSQGFKVGERYAEILCWFLEHLAHKGVYKLTLSPHRYAYYVIGMNGADMVGFSCESTET